MQINPQTNTIYVANLKARDFVPVPPFQLEGRPWLYNEGKFKMSAEPGMAVSLAELKQLGRPKSPERAERVQHVIEWLAKGMKPTEIIAEFGSLATPVKPATVKKYINEARMALKTRRSKF